MEKLLGNKTLVEKLLGNKTLVKKLLREQDSSGNVSSYSKRCVEAVI